MASDYTIAANSILSVLKGIVAQYAAQFPDIGGWEEKAAAELPPIAGQLAKAAVDALAAAHGGNVVPITGVPAMTDPTIAPATTSASNMLQEVLGYLQVGCGVIAEQSAIQMLISALPYGTVAVGVANMVCEAVLSQKSKLSVGGSTQSVTVKGVRIPVHASPFEKS